MKNQHYLLRNKENEDENSIKESKDNADDKTVQCICRENAATEDRQRKMQVFIMSINLIPSYQIKAQVSVWRKTIQKKTTRVKHSEVVCF